MDFLCVGTSLVWEQEWHDELDRERDPGCVID